MKKYLFVFFTLGCSFVEGMSIQRVEEVLDYYRKSVKGNLQVMTILQSEAFNLKSANKTATSGQVPLDLVKEFFPSGMSKTLLNQALLEVIDEIIAQLGQGLA